jgi:hypothetical protein
MEYANKKVQAFNKATGAPIFLDGPTWPSNYWPLGYNQPWVSSQNCGAHGNIDWNVTFDKLNNVWVLFGMAWVLGESGQITNGVLCIAVSTSDNLIQGPANCGGNGEVSCNFWSTYGFDITSLLPSYYDSETHVTYYDQPDYGHNPRDSLL